MEYKRKYEELLVVLIDLYIVDVDEEDDEELANLIQGFNDDAIPRINEVKDKGNYLFSQNQFTNAANLYEQAIKLLCLIGPVEKYDELLCWNLAISLSLNLAACALKLQLYKEAIASCSLVLQFEPLNVKALYRRAMAFLKLNLYKEAYDDLKVGIERDPNNKDIIRELNLLEDKLLVNSNGKKGLSNERSITGDKKSKKSSSANDSICLKSEKGNVVPLVETETTHSQLKSGRYFEEVSYNNKTCNDQIEAMDVSFKESIFESSKRKGGLSRLRVPSLVYQKIQKGEEVSFYNSFSQSYIKVRVIHPKTSFAQDDYKMDEFSSIQRSEIKPMCESYDNVDHLIEDLTLAKNDELVATNCEVEENEGNGGESFQVPVSTNDACGASSQLFFRFNSPSLIVQKSLPRQFPTFEMAANVCVSTKIPNIRLSWFPDSASRTRLRVLRIRATREVFMVRQNKNTYSSFRFSSHWKTSDYCPRLYGVSLYYPAHKPIGTKRKNMNVPELMYSCYMPAKRFCKGLFLANSSLAGCYPKLNNYVVGSIDRVDKCDSASPKTTV